MGYPSFRDSSLECISCKRLGSVHHFLTRKSHASPTRIFEKNSQEKTELQRHGKTHRPMRILKSTPFLMRLFKILRTNGDMKKRTSGSASHDQQGNPPINWGILVFFKAQSDRSCVGLLQKGEAGPTSFSNATLCLTFLYINTYPISYIYVYNII